ncbi:alpha/beta fold hydrolase [Halotalea alkalilenta]|uniref:Alpha/beta hydrolase n=1 Tax=Halotalea alkalilenta TaxID=376489 RepID=A0A172YFP3_9GAMM|nr:alpha/beta fold hydrolase [Halotalea alkalilenta]ANF58089.1 alpha/beta hydrolase [Halotalea alkalilenta]
MATTLYALDSGGEFRAPPLVVLHGLFGSADNWRSPIKAWRDSRRVIALDLRNHGRSPHLDGMAYDQMAEDVLESLTALGVERFVLLGHSMGGKVAMNLARQCADRVERLIVADIAPVAYAHGHEDVFAAMHAVERARAQNRREADAAMAQYVSDAVTRQFLATNLIRGEQQTLEWRVDLARIEADYPAIIAAPGGHDDYPGATLLLRGGRSNYVDAQGVEAAREIFPALRLETIEDAGHWLHAERFDEFKAKVDAFLG